jgi:hypothetical protein
MQWMQWAALMPRCNGRSHGQRARDVSKKAIDRVLLRWLFWGHRWLFERKKWLFGTIKGKTLYSDVMVERLTVVFFIILCVLLGFYLILAPWDRLFGPWGENYLLVYLTDKAGAPILLHVVASNWFRGAVTGLGVVNLLIAGWEAAHFNQSVRMLKNGETRGGK